MAFIISGAKLTLENLADIIQNKPVLEFSPEIKASFKNNVSPVEEENNTVVRTYLEMQTAGFGPQLNEEKVKLGLILGLQALTNTPNGFMPSDLLNRLLAFFNRDISPVILSQSTPTGQNAQLLLAMLGSGKVKYLDYELNAADIMDIFSWQPIQLNATTVAQVMNTAIFSQAALAYNLLKVKAQNEWLTYLGKTFSQISDVDIITINSYLTQFKASFKFIQDAFENSLNNNVDQSELTGNITNGLKNLNAQLNELMASIAGLTTETFSNLISTSEPPATAGFTQALLLTQTLQSQIHNALANISENSSPEVINTILNNKLENALEFIEQLIALAFWAVSQVGKVFNLAAENLTLAAYYHSEFYVSKELVSIQLDNILRFIRTHVAPTLT